jgi:heavy metal sensor kinase
MFKTIRVRLTLWYVVLLAVFLLGFSAALYLTLARSLSQQVDAALQLNAEQLAGAINIEQGQVNFQSSESDVTDAANLGEQGYLVRLIDASGGVADTNARLAALPVAPSALDAARRGQPSLDTFVVNGHSFRVYTRPIVEGSQFYGALQIAQSLDPVASTLRQLLLLLTAIVPLTLVFALAGGFWFARRALGPIDRITIAAQRMSAEDLSQRLGLDLPDDEVGRLARTFDGMLGRLDAAFRRERQFTADASHELRTPLTAMRGEIDVTLNRPRSAAEYRRVLEELGGDVDRLTRLAEDLLTLARADAGRLPLDQDTLNVSQLLRAVAEQLRPLAESKNISIEVRADDALVAWADEDKLLRVMLNLVDNALKFTPAGGRVMLSASRATGQVELAVSDTGAGMSAQDLAHIFERFYRADESHSPGTGGAGLGLAIAHSLVAAQSGTIEVRSALGQGTTFVVKLPSKEK